MNYTLLVILFIATTVIHYHYYKWRIFNPDHNLPQIYRSHTGVLVVFLSKILLFGLTVLILSWYIVLIIFIFLQVLKFITFNRALRWHTTHSYVLQGRKLLRDNNLSKENVDSKLSKEKSKEIWEQEKKIYKGILFKYKNKQLSGPLFSKILYLVT